MKYLLLLFLMASICFAGQGIVLPAGQSVGNSNIPKLSIATSYRIELSVQGIPANCPEQDPFYGNIGGMMLTMYCASPNSYLYINPPTEAGYSCCSLISNFPSAFSLRYSHDVVNKLDKVQVWDINGNLVGSQIWSWTSVSSASFSNGVSVASNSNGLTFNYARMYSALSPNPNRPPITDDTTANLIFQWKFDGNLNDSGPSNYTGILSSGSPSYTATLGQNLIVPVLTNTTTSLYSPNNPVVVDSNGVSFQPSVRAGYPATFNCNNSYTQEDTLSSLTCLWQVIPQAGQPTPFLDNPKSQTPTLSGLIFGEYLVQLTVTDSVNNISGQAQTHLGAVATDANGVVVNSNPAADAILGPMIAFGQNPWSEEDYWHLWGSVYRYNQYLGYGLSPTWPYAMWETPQTGTISYNWNGHGMAAPYLDNSYGTTWASSCTSSATSCTVANATKLDLTTLPTRIYVSTAGSQRNNFEEIRVCSVNGNILTFCYDGRGWADSNTNRVVAQSWNTGDYVGQDKITGSGTSFSTTLCPAGVPGQSGTIVYNIGTVAVTAGSTTATLTGGTWISTYTIQSFSSNIAGMYIQISGTHSSTPFVFMSQISSLTNSAQLVMSRPYPSDADTASGLTYSIVIPNLYLDTQYQVPQGSSTVSFMRYWPTMYGCESNTALFIYPAWDIPAVDGTILTGMTYSYQENNFWYNQSSTGGLDFYSEDLANLALWLRSGLKTAHDAAMMIGDIWSRMPQKSNGGNGSLLFYGGPTVGGFANAMLSDTGHGTQWKDLRSFALGAIGGYPGVAASGHDCNNDDSREDGYQGAFLALAAEFDPDTTSTTAPGGISWHQYWQNALVQYVANETTCENLFGTTDNSWRVLSFPESLGSANAVTLTNGSSAGTGSGLSNSYCFGIANVTNVTVTNGSSIVTGTGFPTTGWNRVAITGPGLIGRDGNTVPTLWVYATPNSSTQFTIGYGAVWPGTNNSTATVMFDNGHLNNPIYPDGFTQFSQSVDDPAGMYQYSCIYNSSTSITLNRPFTGTSGVNYGYTSNVTGFNILPYMLGIRQYALWQAQNATATSQPTLSNEFSTLRNNAGVYENFIYDPVAGANYYAIQPACDPITLASMGNGVCYSGYPPTGLPGAAYGYTAQRVNTIENSMSLSDYYISQNGSPASIAWGDMMYGNCMGNPSYTTGVYTASDGNTCENGNMNSSVYGIPEGKWYGFFFGMGASWRWPAQRLGGVQPAQLQNAYVGFSLSGVSGATQIIATVIAPSGAVVNQTCSTSPCVISMDNRQGTHLYKITYLDALNNVLAVSNTLRLLGN